MLIEYIVLFLLGIAAGVVAGILPGLHVNNIGVMALPLIAAFGIDPLSFAIFLVAMATSQTFLNFIPSIFLGAPEEGTVLSLLPTHKMLIEGRALEAVRITAKASLYGVILSLLFLPLAFVLVPVAYSAARAFVVPLLLLAISYLILRERSFEKKLWASATFLISGYFGWTCLNISSISTSDIMLPMFSGLFGLSTLILSLNDKSTTYSQQADSEIRISDKSLWRNSLLGTIGGILVGLLPAMSPSQIGIMLQEAASIKDKVKGSVKKPLEDVRTRQFIATVASLNCADSLFSIFAIYLMGNPRSGVSVILQDVFGSIDFATVAILAGVMLLAGCVSYHIHICIGSWFSKAAGRIDSKKLSLAGIIFVIGLVAATGGLFGLLVAIVSTAIGMVPALTGVSRTHCMGCLLVPTLLFFLGL